MNNKTQNFSVENTSISQEIVDNGTYKVRMHYAPVSGIAAGPGGCYGPPDVEIIISDPNAKLSLEKAFNIMVIGHNNVDFILNYGNKTTMDVRANEVSMISQMDRNGNIIPVFKINKDGSFTDVRPKSQLYTNPVSDTKAKLTDAAHGRNSLVSKKVNS